MLHLLSCHLTTLTLRHSCEWAAAVHQGRCLNLIHLCQLHLLHRNGTLVMQQYLTQCRKATLRCALPPHYGSAAVQQVQLAGVQQVWAPAPMHYRQQGNLFLLLLHTFSIQYFWYVDSLQCCIMACFLCKQCSLQGTSSLGTGRHALCCNAWHGCIVGGFMQCRARHIA